MRYSFGYIIVVFGLLALFACNNSKEAKEYFRKAKIAQEANDHQTAVNLFSKAIESSPNNDTFRVERGYSYYITQKPDLALSDLGKALEINPENADALYIRGLVHYYNQNERLAIADFGKVILFSDVLKRDALIERARCFYNLGESIKALNDLTSAIAIDSSYAYAFYFRGLVRNNPEGKDMMMNAAFSNQLALEDLNEALELSPDFAEALAEISIVYWKMQRPNIGKEYIEKALKLDRNNADFLLQLARCEMILQNLTSAEEILNRLVEENPQNALFLYERGLFFKNFRENSLLACADFMACKKLGFEPNELLLANCS